MESKKLLFEKIWEKQKDMIGDVNIKNPKRLIFIAGAPGSGKTTLLKELQKRLNCLYIRSDDIRDILNYEFKNNILANDPEVKNEYINYIFQAIIPEFENQTIIMDMSLDRNVEFGFSFAQSFSYPKYIISLNCSYKVLAERLNAREGEYKNAFLENLPKWFSDHEKFNNLGVSDITFDTENTTVDDMVSRIMRDLQ